MKAVIVAAGRGSRLLNNKPKTLLPLDKSTILEHILRNLQWPVCGNLLLWWVTNSK